MLYEKIKLAILIIIVLLLALAGFKQARLEAQIQRVDDRIEFTQQRMLYELDLQEQQAQLMKSMFNKSSAAMNKILMEVK